MQQFKTTVNIQAKYKESLVRAHTLLSAEEAYECRNKDHAFLMKAEQGEYFWATVYTRVPKTSQLAYNEQGQAVFGISYWAYLT